MPEIPRQAHEPPVLPRPAHSPPFSTDVPPLPETETIQPTRESSEPVAPREVIFTIPVSRRLEPQPANSTKLPTTAAALGSIAVPAEQSNTRRRLVTARIPEGDQPPSLPKIPDLRRLILAAQAEIPDAAEKLDTVIETVVGNIFEVHPEASPAVRQQLIRTIQQTVKDNGFNYWSILPGTPPTEIHRAIMNRFTRYVGVVTQQILKQNEARQAAKGQPEPNSEARPIPEVVEADVAVDTTARLVAKENIRSILAPRQYIAVSMRLDNQSYNQVAEALGVNYDIARQLVSRARRAIERRILEPAGILQLSDFPDAAAIQKAVSDTGVKTMEWLGVTYFSDAWRNDTIPQVYFDLDTIASDEDIQALRREHPEYVTECNGVDFIHQSGLAALGELRRARAVERREPLPPPREGYIAVDEVTATRAEALALHRFINRRKYHTLYNDQGQAFVSVVAVERYRKEGESNQ